MQGLPSLTVIVGRLPLSYKEPDGKGNNKDDDKPHANLIVVDDDSDIAYVLKQGLLKDGFLVSAFTIPKEAYKASFLIHRIITI